MLTLTPNRQTDRHTHPGVLPLWPSQSRACFQSRLDLENALWGAGSPCQSSGVCWEHDQGGGAEGHGERGRGEGRERLRGSARSCILKDLVCRSLIRPLEAGGDFVRSHHPPASPPRIRSEDKEGETPLSLKLTPKIDSALPPGGGGSEPARLAAPPRLRHRSPFSRNSRSCPGTGSLGITPFPPLPPRPASNLWLGAPPGWREGTHSERSADSDGSLAQPGEARAARPAGTGGSGGLRQVRSARPLPRPLLSNKADRFVFSPLLLLVNHTPAALLLTSLKGGVCCLWR